MSTTLDEHQNPDPPRDRERSMREILDARAVQLSQSLSNDPLASAYVEVLNFSIGRDRFAIETRYVTEVLHDVAVTPLPGDTQPLMGLANLRGEVLSIMSLSGVLPLGSDVDADLIGNWIIVLGIDQVMFGIAVSDVTEVVAFPHEEILESSSGMIGNHARVTRGVTADARVVLNGREVLEDARFVIDQE